MNIGESSRDAMLTASSSVAMLLTHKEMRPAVLEHSDLVTPTCVNRPTRCHYRILARLPVLAAGFCFAQETRRVYLIM